MDSKIPIINKDNEISFFYELEVGDVFKFEITDYIWEDIYNIAISQGKKIKQINENNFLYNIINSSGGIIIRDIKKSAENIRDEEILRLKAELSNCYKRIDNLETQVGIRGIERLNRCEICKNHVLPYQSNIKTDTGVEHTECNLNQIISDLNKSINKKDETLKKWVKDSQRIGSENQSLRIERDQIKDKISELQQEVNTLTEINEVFYNEKIECKNIVLKLESDNSNNLKNIKELENINKIYENLLRDILGLIIRVVRLLGDNSGLEFIPIPVINLNGEQRIELKGWCKPLFDELCICMNNIKECL